MILYNAGGADKARELGTINDIVTISAADANSAASGIEQAGSNRRA